MSNFFEFITFEHESEHDLSENLNYSIPKIYTANDDLTKRWYVYFSFRDPNTGKMKRMKNFYGKANLHKTKAERLYELSSYQRKILELLRKGFSPFKDNTVVNQINRPVKKKQQPIEESVAPIQEPNLINGGASKMLIKEALEFSLKVKSKQVAKRTHDDYGYKIKSITDWVKKNEPTIITIDQLDKLVCQRYLNAILEKTSARTRNNNRTALSSILQTLEDNDVISSNPMQRINVLRSIPEKHKTYSIEDELKIFKYLEKEDPILLLYIKFISYNLLRPIEVCRLKVGDINLNEKTIQFKAKNSKLKKKIIPDILIQELPDLSNLDKNLLLFTPKKIGASWDSKEKNRRTYFSKQFKKIVKDSFGLGTEYDLYSFRHTYITKLYKKLLESMTPNEAKNNLMLITGHNTMVALEKYLRDIDTELPQDYSNLLS